MNKVIFNLAISFMACLIIAGCSDQPDSAATSNEKLTVYTVNYPLAYFTARIAGNQVDVVFPEMEGDPAFWEPGTEEISAFQNADIILLNGASYARWVSKASLPESRMVDTSSKLSDRFIGIEGGKTHSHGPAGEHDHGGTAFTTWLDLTQAIQQAAAIDSKLDLSGSGFDELQNDLLELDREWEAAFAKLTDQPLMGSHPVYQYLARRYQINLRSVHWEPDVAPDQDMLDELKSLRRKHPANTMLWEGEPLAETKSLLSSMGITSIVFDPCGNRPAAGDFLSVMKQNLANLNRVVAPD